MMGKEKEGEEKTGKGRRSVNERRGEGRGGRQPEVECPGPWRMFHHLPPSSTLSYGNNSNFTTKQRLYASSSPFYFSLSVSPYFSLWLYHFSVSIFLSSGFLHCNHFQFTYAHIHTFTKSCGFMRKWNFSPS